MNQVTDSLVDGAWLTQPPTYHGQPVRVTTYFDDGTFGFVEYLFEGNPEVADMRVTKRSFLKKRMTESEYVRIDLASYGQTENAAKIRRFMEMFRSSQYFDLSLPSNRTDLQLMEDIGLLDAAGRADEILSLPITDDERYKD